MAAYPGTMVAGKPGSIHFCLLGIAFKCNGTW